MPTDKRDQHFLLSLEDRLRPLQRVECVAQAATEAMAELLGATRVVFIEANAERTYARIFQHFDAAEHDISGHQPWTELETFVRDALDRAALASTRERHISERITLHLTSEMRSALAVPIATEADTSVVLIVETERAQMLTTDELHLTQAAADRAWAGLMRAKTSEALEAAVRRETFRARLADRLRLARTEDEVQTIAVSELGLFLSVSRVAFVRVAADGERLEFGQNFLADGMASLDGSVRLDQFGAAFLADVRSGHTLVQHDIRRSPKFRADEWALYERLGIVAVVGVPVMKNGQLAGGLLVHNNVPRSWSESDVALITDTAERIWSSSERVRVEEALRRSEQEARSRLAELEAIYQSAPVGLCTFDRDLRFVRINERLAEINGVPVDAHLGRTVREVVPDLADAADALATQIFATGEPALNVEIVGETPAASGARRTWIEQWIPVRNEQGEVACISVVAEEVTEARRAAAERERLVASLETAWRDADAANRAKSQFLAVMSHELRTPLHAIAGYTELLGAALHGPINDAQRRALGRIQANQQHLAQLINGVLDYAQLELGSIRIDVTDVALREALIEAEGLVRPQADAKQLQLTLIAPPDAWKARADRDRVRQILANLLSNAIKFTPSGGRIDVRVRSEASELVVSVHDTGPGIAPEDRARVFEPFVSVNPPGVGASDGTGLGLTISRDLARRMGGDIRIEDSENGGATLSLVLPKLGSSRHTDLAVGPVHAADH